MVAGAVRIVRIARADIFFHHRRGSVLRLEIFIVRRTRRNRQDTASGQALVAGTFGLPRSRLRVQRRTWAGDAQRIVRQRSEHRPVDAVRANVGQLRTIEGADRVTLVGREVGEGAASEACARAKT